MPRLDTAELLPGKSLPPSISHQVYCGLDSAVLPEIHSVLSEQIRGSNDQAAARIYEFEKQLQGPYLEMMLRGFAVDERARRAVSEELGVRIGELRTILDQLSFSVWDAPGLNPRSSQQLKDLFYGVMHLPEITTSKKGERKVSMERDTLERLSDYLYARPFISVILEIRGLAKQKEVFDTEIDREKGGGFRHRSSYNISGTETGRPSSSSSAWGTGGNAQNIAPGLRWAFVSDPGMKLGQVDLEQVEARDVGFICGCLFDDWSFLDACESGDFHTTNARLIWKDRPWTGDLRRDRKLADEIFYRDFSYRDMAKRGGHLTDYMGTAWTMAKHLKIPLPLAEDFQARFCRGRQAQPQKGLPAVEPAYPVLPKWWQWIATQLQTTGYLENLFGRRRHFFGRHDDDATLREAIAFQPQSTTADRMNLGLWRIWKKLAPLGVEILGQTYDSVTYQYPDRGPAFEEEVSQAVLEAISVPFLSPSGRSFDVPGEVKVGWNWGARVTEADQQQARQRGQRVPRLNLDGLVKWGPSAPDLRTRTRPLERVI